MAAITNSLWKTTAEHYYERFRIFNAKRSTRINPRTGNSTDYFLMEGLDWANVIPITPDGQVVMVKQYRHGVDQYTLEIPGGVVEVAEQGDPSQSAMRELREETGYSGNDIVHLGTVQANPAMQNMRAHTYLARNVTLSHPTELDAGEDIEVILKPLSEVFELIRGGTIQHAIIVSAFMLYKLWEDPRRP